MANADAFSSWSCVFLFDRNQYVFSFNLFIVATACHILGIVIQCLFLEDLTICSDQMNIIV